MTQHAAFTRGNSAVITGAADGIGRAAACAFAGFGMNVLLCDIDSEQLDMAVAAARASADGGTILGRVVDVADYAAVEEMKAAAYAVFGRVDVLMNNAGTSVKTGSFDALDGWQHLIAVNLWGVIHGVQAFTQSMVDQHAPALIINTGSKQGITNPPGNPAYNVSKAGVKAATESLQHTLRNIDGCQVSAHLLVPGFTYTGLVRRVVNEKPDGAWMPEDVVSYLIDAVNRGSFYIICPDNEVTSAEDARRILWGAGDLAHDRTPLSRWDPAYADEFAAFKPD
ncbi:MAG: SDR family NAD(P)-dependent oxidoreductase [Gammaproteobacteria bacterium]